MENIYSNFIIKQMNPMRVASYSIISENPEDEVYAYMRQWIEKNRLKFHSLRSFGFDIFIDEHQKSKGLSGYECWVVVPESIQESENVKIKKVPAGKYAVLRIRNPLSKPNETIPKGWKMLRDWVIKNAYEASHSNHLLPMLEEIIATDEGTFMDLYFPIS